MLNGLAGWLVGFNGDFGFEQIGDNYTTNEVWVVSLLSNCFAEADG